jgi:hypothetical protein
LEACKPGTPLLVNDTVLPEPGEATAYEEHGLRQVDLAMWIGYSSRQRTAREFGRLLAQADSRLKVCVPCCGLLPYPGTGTDGAYSLSRSIARGLWDCLKCIYGPRSLESYLGETGYYGRPDNIYVGDPSQESCTCSSVVRPGQYPVIWSSSKRLLARLECGTLYC